MREVTLVLIEGGETHEIRNTGNGPLKTPTLPDCLLEEQATRSHASIACLGSRKGLREPRATASGRVKLW
jgi:hypothetical protein